MPRCSERKFFNTLDRPRSRLVQEEARDSGRAAPTPAASHGRSKSRLQREAALIRQRMPGVEWRAAAVDVSCPFTALHHHAPLFTGTNSQVKSASRSHKRIANRCNLRSRRLLCRGSHANETVIAQETHLSLLRHPNPDHGHALVCDHIQRREDLRL